MIYLVISSLICKIDDYYDQNNWQIKWHSISHSSQNQHSFYCKNALKFWNQLMQFCIATELCDYEDPWKSQNNCWNNSVAFLEKVKMY